MCAADAAVAFADLFLQELCWLRQGLAVQAVLMRWQQPPTAVMAASTSGSVRRSAGACLPSTVADGRATSVWVATGIGLTEVKPCDQSSRRVFAYAHEGESFTSLTGTTDVHAAATSTSGQCPRGVPIVGRRDHLVAGSWRILAGGG